MDKAQLHDRIGDVKNSSNAVAERGASMAHQAVNKGADFVHQAAEKGSDFAKQASDFAHQAADKGAQYKKAIVDSGTQALKTSETFIKDNPHSMVMSAFTFGALLGAGLTFLFLVRK